MRKDHYMYCIDNSWLISFIFLRFSARLRCALQRNEIVKVAHVRLCFRIVLVHRRVLLIRNIAVDVNWLQIAYWVIFIFFGVIVPRNFPFFLKVSFDLSKKESFPLFLVNELIIEVASNFLFGKCCILGVWWAFILIFFFWRFWKCKPLWIMWRWSHFVWARTGEEPLASFKSRQRAKLQFLAIEESLDLGCPFCDGGFFGGDFDGLVLFGQFLESEVLFFEVFFRAREWRDGPFSRFHDEGKL